jgi:hypothetical protein
MKGYSAALILKTVAAFEECASWHCCDWDERRGACEIDLNGVSAEEAAERGTGYRMVAGGSKLNDRQVREMRNARRALGQPDASKADTATRLADDYEASVLWLLEVERDAALAYKHVCDAAVEMTALNTAAAWETLKAAEALEAAYGRPFSYAPLKEFLTDVMAKKIFDEVGDELGIHSKEEARAYIENAMSRKAGGAPADDANKKSAGEPVPLTISIENDRVDLLERLKVVWGQFEQATKPPLRYRVTEIGRTPMVSNGIACSRPWLIVPAELVSWAQIIVSTRLLDESESRRNLTFLHECIHLYFAFGPHRQRRIRIQATEDVERIKIDQVLDAQRHNFMADRLRNALTFTTYPEEIVAEQYLQEHYPGLFPERGDYLLSMRAAADMELCQTPMFRKYWLFYELLRRRFCANLVAGPEVRQEFTKLAETAERMVRESCSAEEWKYFAEMLPRLLDIRYDQPLEEAEAAYAEIYNRIMSMEFPA